MKRLFERSAPLLIVAALVASAPTSGQTGRGRGAAMADDTHAADMQLFHQLFDHRKEITRRVIMRTDGVETFTESRNPEVARLLQTHVAAMLARVRDGRPVHRRDPLFAELFKFADRIEAWHETTARGVHVLETSADPYVVKLLQAHAAVIDAFIANGRAEMMKDHPIPPRIPGGTR